MTGSKREQQKLFTLTTVKTKPLIQSLIISLQPNQHALGGWKTGWTFGLKLVIPSPTLSQSSDSGISQVLILLKIFTNNADDGISLVITTLNVVCF